MKSMIRLVVVLPMLVSAACASQSAPAETSPAAAEAAEGGEHTMPDGTKMKGHHHGHSSHAADASVEEHEH